MPEIDPTENPPATSVTLAESTSPLDGGLHS